MSAIYYLENDFLKIAVKQKGAELCSLFNKEKETEHLWQADAAVWGRHAPILFPLVGQVEDGEYFVNGKRFELGQHGFARDMDFSLIASTNEALVFELTHSEKSLSLYPFKFSLQVCYELSPVGWLKVSYKVKNMDEQTMYFNLGGHPGFVVPFEENTTFEDYELHFSEKETLDRILLNEKGLLTGKVQRDFLKEEEVIPLSFALFDEDALVFTGFKSPFISIVSRKSGQFLSFGLGDFPFLGIWTKPKAQAPFLCIEPWYGHTAQAGASKELQDRVGVSSLRPGEELEDSFTIATGIGYNGDLGIGFYDDEI